MAKKKKAGRVEEVSILKAIKAKAINTARAIATRVDTEGTVKAKAVMVIKRVMA